MDNFKCEKCGKEFQLSGRYRNHVKNCDPVGIICKHPGCERKFSKASNLNRHYRDIHENQNLPQYKCTLCDTRFRRKLQLKQHRKSAHNVGEYIHNCETCNRGFFSSIAYTNHLRAHAGKDNICTECNTNFRNWTELVKHRRLHHSTTKQFQCDLCSKTFTRKPNIKEHMKLHLAKDKTYACHYEDCSKFYTAKRNLNAHIKSKHEGKKFICSICKCKLSTKQKLEKHIAAHDDPERAKLIKKPTVAVILGIQMHKNIEDELLLKLPEASFRETVTSAESEFSDNNN